jgi:thioester reductase-like protein
MDADFLVVGATGQIGRHIVREAAKLGSVIVAMRRRSSFAARNDLALALGEVASVLEGQLEVVVGDAAVIDFPNTRHIINACGLTKFSGPFDAYWRSNVLTAVNLATHAAAAGAHLHHLSTISVAVGRPSRLTEADLPTPSSRQSAYSYSKVLAELAVLRLMGDKLSIYRVPDVVPPVGRIAEEIRRDHWLTLVAGTGCVDTLPPGYRFHAVATDEIASTVLSLAMGGDTGCYNLFGPVYELRVIAGKATTPSAHALRVASQVGKLVTSGVPLPDLVDQATTMDRLAAINIRWSGLDDRYWAEFVAVARRRVRGTN